VIEPTKLSMVERALITYLPGVRLSYRNVPSTVGPDSRILRILTMRQSTEPHWPLRRVLALFALLGTLLVPAGVRLKAGSHQAQPVCPASGCTIELTKVIDLSDTGHSGLLPGELPFVVRDRPGRFYIVTGDRQHVAVFDAHGQFVRELGTPTLFAHGGTLVPDRNGNVLAWDLASGKAFEIDAALRVIVEPAAPSYPPAFVRSDGTMVVAKEIPTADLIGFPVHLFSSDGHIRKSFGVDTPEYRTDLRLMFERVVAPSTDDMVWTAPVGRYLLEKWNPETGKRLRQLNVHSTWFVESDRFPNDSTVRPNPIVQGLWNRDGLVWVLCRDADAHWKPVKTDPESAWDLRSYEAAYDWILEAVDEETGEVLASRRFDKGLWGRSPQPFLVSHALATANGPHRLEVWIPQLNRR
jgi:hypothetical protein